MSEEEEWDYSFSWRIENISSFFVKISNQLESPAFKVKSIAGRKWCIEVKQASNSKDNKDYISCYLTQMREKDSDKECNVKFEMCLMNVHSENLKTVNAKSRIFGREFDSWGWSIFIDKNRVLSEIEKYNEDTLIVRCRIKNKEVKKMIEKEGRTRINAEKYVFEWNVRLLPNEIFPTSRHFFCLEDLLYEINISLKDGDIKINVCKMTKSTLSSRSIIGKISLLDSKGNETIAKTETHTFDLEKEIWKFPSLITKEQLQGKIGEYLIDQKIIFLCEFSVCNTENTSIVSNVNSEYISNIDGLVNLSEDFRCLLANKTNTDVKLQTAEGVTLQAHRSVLIARSPVFSAIFDRDMLEHRTGTVDMENVEGSTLELFLRFLYTGVVENMDCVVATKLLMVADKYQVLNLKEKCALFLMSAVSMKNVSKILVLADMVHHKVLKATCLDFVAKHGAKIFSLPGCSNWIRENPELSAEILVLACSETTC